MRHALWFTLVTLVLAGCSLYEQLGVKAGTSTEADVRRAMGAPGLELANPDGTRQLAYPKGPLGTNTYMVHLTRAGVVDRVEQVLTDDTINRIYTGRTTSEEVRRMLGPPWRVARFENLKQNAWDYRFRDTWGYLADLSVMIDDRGIVASKVIARIESGRDGGMNR